MDEEACCTCAALLSSIPPTYDEKTEKPTVHERRLECCDRAICARCTTDNPRFATYCPFCQVSITPSPLPQGLRDPPSYSPPPEGGVWAQSTLDPKAGPPPYTERVSVDSTLEKTGSAGQDVLHFVDPTNDSINLLSIRYGVPANALRRTNGLYSDHLLAARRTILIPWEFYKGGVSLSPRPLEGEEEEARKSKVRKWMVACKVAEYDLALLYLKQSDYDLETAIEAFKADEQWEREHPLDASSKGKGKVRTSRFRSSGSGGLTGQLR